MLSCSIELHLLFTGATVYNYKLIPTKRGGVVVFSLSLFTPNGTMYLEMSTGFMIYGPLCFWRVSISVHVEHRIPDAALRCTTRTRLALSSLLYTADFSTSLQVPGEFQANSMMLLNSILFEIPRDVVWSEVRLRQAGVCK